MSRFDAIGSDIPEQIESHSEEEKTFQASGLDPKSIQELELTKQQVDGLELKVEHFKILYKLRRNVAIFIFFLIFVWLLCVMALVFLGSYEVSFFQGSCGFLDTQSWYQKLTVLPEGCAFVKSGNFLNLSEAIVIALITTTTANVLGLSYIVAKWLFPKSANDNSDTVPTSK